MKCQPTLSPMTFELDLATVRRMILLKIFLVKFELPRSFRNIISIEQGKDLPRSLLFLKQLAKALLFVPISLHLTVNIFIIEASLHLFELIKIYLILIFFLFINV